MHSRPRCQIVYLGSRALCVTRAHTTSLLPGLSDPVRVIRVWRFGIHRRYDTGHDTSLSLEHSLSNVSTFLDTENPSQTGCISCKYIYVGTTLLLHPNVELSPSGPTPPPLSVVYLIGLKRCQPPTKPILIHAGQPSHLLASSN